MVVVRVRVSVRVSPNPDPDPNPKRTPRTQAMRTEMLGLVDGLSAYHLLRGTTVEKVTKAPSKSTDEETKVSPDPDPALNPLPHPNP